jgi:hypothetical protein
VIAGMGGNINANGTSLFPNSISEPMKKWSQYVLLYNKVKLFVDCYLFGKELTSYFIGFNSLGQLELLQKNT